MSPPDVPVGLNGVSSLADLMYLVLLIGGFLVLALCLRGLEKL